jgi:hypothetical protein
VGGDGRRRGWGLGAASPLADGCDGGGSGKEARVQYTRGGLTGTTSPTWAADTFELNISESVDEYCMFRMCNDTYT